MANNNKKILIAVSALALRALTPVPALAGLSVNCTGDLRFNRFIACAAGTISITPAGATGTPGTACFKRNIKAQVGSCTIQTDGTPIVSSVKAKFTALFLKPTRAGETVIVNGLSMQNTTTATPQATLTLSPTDVSNTVRINIGGNLNFDGNETVGQYVGQIRMSVN